MYRSFRILHTCTIHVYNQSCSFLILLIRQQSTWHVRWPCRQWFHFPIDLGTSVSVPTCILWSSLAWNRSPPAGGSTSSSQLCASPSLSLTPTLMAHYYFTPSFLISTTTLKFIFALSASFIYFSLLYFIPRERTQSSYSQRPAELNYTIMLFWLRWGMVRGRKRWLNKTFINLKSHSQYLFFTRRQGAVPFNVLLFNRHTIACRTRNEPLPLLVHSIFPTFFITKPDPHLLVIFLILLLFSFQVIPHQLRFKNM